MQRMPQKSTALGKKKERVREENNLVQTRMKKRSGQSSHAMNAEQLVISMANVNTLLNTARSVKQGQEELPDTFC